MALNTWSPSLGAKHIYNWDGLSDTQQLSLLEQLESKFPFPFYLEQGEFKDKALQAQKNLVQQLRQSGITYPETLSLADFEEDEDYIRKALSETAILITAGGDGERLKESLFRQKIYTQAALESFTKASIELPGLRNVSTLSYSLCYFEEVFQRYALQQPLFVSVGPPGSQNERLTTKYLQNHSFQGIKKLEILPQGERLHLDNQNRIHWKMGPGQEKAQLITHPDETGGPLVALSTRKNRDGVTYLEALEQQGIKRVILIQGTAVFRQEIPLAMIQSCAGYDAIGVGVPTRSEKEQEHLGAFVLLEHKDQRKLLIVEPSQKNDKIKHFFDQNRNQSFPGNTGFYVYSLDLLRGDLPHYASGLKTIAGYEEKAPKIGFAAINYLEQAQRSRVLLIEADDYATLKEAADLPTLAERVRTYQS